MFEKYMHIRTHTYIQGYPSTYYIHNHMCIRDRDEHGDEDCEHVMNNDEQEQANEEENND